VQNTDFLCRRSEAARPANKLFDRVMVGRPVHDDLCPLLGAKRTLIGRSSMSAFDPKRTLAV